MLLEGSIRRFELASVLQFLATNAATGVLEVRDFEEYGFVYIVDGRVEGISLPFTDERLGTKLVKAGYITDAQLTHVLMEDSMLSRDERKLKPLGQRLIDLGLIDESQLREVLNQQVRDQVFELAQWRDGVFIYHEPEEMPRFQAKIRANVQLLLLDAYRRIDEGQQARKRYDTEAQEICHKCPIASSCTDEIKTKYLKSDVCLWRKMTSQADERREGLDDSREMYRSREADRAVLDTYTR